MYKHTYVLLSTPHIPGITHKLSYISLNPHTHLMS